MDNNKLPDGWGDPTKASNFAETPNDTDIFSSSDPNPLLNQPNEDEPVEESDILKKSKTGIIALIVVLVVLIPVGMFGLMYLGGDGSNTNNENHLSSESKNGNQSDNKNGWQASYERIINGNNEPGRPYGDGYNEAGRVIAEAMDSEGNIDWDQFKDSSSEQFIQNIYFRAEFYNDFSLVDFDGNGIPELVIRVNYLEGPGLGYDIYSYENENVIYTPSKNASDEWTGVSVGRYLFMENSTNRYIAIVFGEGDVYSYAYDFKNGKFVHVERYAEIITDDWEDSDIRIGNTVYPVKDFLDVWDYNDDGEKPRLIETWEKEGFTRFDYSNSPDFETALSAYLKRETN